MSVIYICNINIYIYIYIIHIYIHIYIYTHFFIRNTYIGNINLKLGKNSAKAQQYPDAELLLFENYSLSSCTFLSHF